MTFYIILFGAGASGSTSYQGLAPHKPLPLALDLRVLGNCAPVENKLLE